MRGYSTKHQRSRELLFGITVAAVILGTGTLAAFNGGLSLEAGKLQMRLDASFSQGMKLSFASI